MNNSALLEQVANLLMVEGSTAEQARQQINNTAYASEQQLNITADEVEAQQSLQTLVQQMPGLTKAVAAFGDKLQDNDNISLAIAQLRQQHQLMTTSWDVFKELRWSACIYMMVLSVMVLVLHFLVAPQFSEIYTSFGAELPAITLLYFSQGNLAAILLIIIWLLTAGYLINIEIIARVIKSFDHVPAWVYRIPVIRGLADSLSRCMVLSSCQFYYSFNQFKLPSQQQWQSIVALGCEKNWASGYYQNLHLAQELNLSQQLLEQDLLAANEAFIKACAKSMKIVATVAGAFLAAFVASILLAMYLPIFQMGSVI